MQAGKRAVTRVLAVIAPIAALLVASCEVGPDYKTPKDRTPAQFNEIESATRPNTPSSTQPISADMQPDDYQRWWSNFNDPILNSLIDRAAKGNLDLVAAEARIREARAQRGIVASGLFPQASADGSFSRARASSNVIAGSGGEGFIPGIASNLWQAGFDATWEIDVFGGTRRGIEAANYNIEAAVEDKRDVLVTLMSEVAVNYIQLRGAQYELAIAEKNLKSQQQTLQLTRSKAEGGLSPYLDVAQQEAQVATTAATIPTFQASIRLNIHHLGILLGTNPGALSAELSEQAPIPVGPESVPPGVPSDLVRRRPDVRRAERQLASQTAQIGVATSDLFPQFSITGALGTEAAQFRKLFDYSSRFYSIAPGVTWDIFDAGKVQSNIDVQNALQAQALATYRKAVLQSLQDVDDALITYNREQVRRQYLREAVAANQKSVDLSTDLFEKGSSDFLSVLDAQRSLFAAEDALAQSEQTVSTDLVALYKALGGGWEDKEKCTTRPDSDSK
jgi:outer membrane protein, multidrug efflux system